MIHFVLRTQPLTEMSIRVGERLGKCGWYVGLTTLPISCPDFFLNLWASTSWNPQDLSRPVTGIALALTIIQLAPQNRHIFINCFFPKYSRSLPTFIKPSGPFPSSSGAWPLQYAQRQSNSVLKPQAAYLKSTLILPSHLHARLLQFLFLSFSLTRWEAFKTPPHINGLFFHVPFLPGFPI